MKSFEKAVIRLLKKERFYGNFILNMKRIFTNKVPTAGVSVTDQMNLYVNPDFFNGLTSIQQEELLKHEAMHLINGHIFRSKEMNVGKSQHKDWNIACDIPINSPLTSLHETGVTWEALSKQIKNLLPDETAEYYYKEIKRYKKENKKEIKGDTVDDHSTWEESTGSKEVIKSRIKEGVKDAIEKAGGIGNCPEEVKKQINELFKSSVNWKQELRSFFDKCSESVPKKSRKKRNRRYGTMFPGKLIEPKLTIAIGLDESGSVADEFFVQFFSEIDYIKGLYKDKIIIEVIQADVKINTVTTYEKGMEIQRTGMGGTYYNPLIKKAIELKVDGMILFGDGGCWENSNDLVKPKFNFLWAQIENTLPPVEWGRVCEIKRTKA